MKYSKHAEKECFAIIRAKVVAFGNEGWMDVELRDQSGKKKIVRLLNNDVRELEFINVAE